MTKIMKNNIQVCLLVIFIVIAGIKCKPNRYELQGENGFKVILEETNNVPKKFHPDLLAKYKDKTWRDMIDSARLRNLKSFTKHEGITTIKIKNNKTIQFIDPPEPGDGIQKYDYLFFIPEIDSHLVSCLFWEVSGYVLASNSTGTTHGVWNIPNISPDKTKFAVANEDLFARFDPNGIQIFEIVSGKYVKKFEREFDWGPDNIRWIDNNTFIVDKYIVDKYDKKPAGHVIFKLVDVK